MTIRKVSATTYALFLANQTVLRILDKMPRYDLIEEAQEILIEQADILQSQIDGDLMHPQDLNDFIEICNNIYDHYKMDEEFPSQKTIDSN